MNDGRLAARGLRGKPWCGWVWVGLGKMDYGKRILVKKTTTEHRIVCAFHAGYLPVSRAGSGTGRGAGRPETAPLSHWVSREEIQDIRTQREAGHLDTDALCDVVTGGEIHDAEKLPLVLALRKQKISEG